MKYFFLLFLLLSVQIKAVQPVVPIKAKFENSNEVNTPALRCSTISTENGNEAILGESESASVTTNKLVEPASWRLDVVVADTARTEIPTNTPTGVVTRLNIPARSKVNHPAVFSPYLLVQKTIALYWEGGFGVDFTHRKLADERLHFSVDYLTSRLGSAWGTNALKQDYFSVGAYWHAWHNSPVRWINGLKSSHFMVDYEDDVFNNLPSSTFLLAF